jgi:hypothetical protein
MKHTVFFFMTVLSATVLCLCPAGCAGTPETLPDYRNGPHTGDWSGLPVFIGVASARYLPNGRNRAIELALRDAARQVAFFHGVEAVIKTTETYDPQLRVTRITETRELVYDTDFEKHLPLLEFNPERDVYEEHGALFVRAAYTGAGGGIAHIDIEGIEGRPLAAGIPAKPSWVENPPSEYGGFVCAIGVAASRLHHKDTVTASYEDALFALVKNSFSEVYAFRQETGHTMLDTSVILVRGAVKGFFIWETWRDPESGAVWTLAAAREVTRIAHE